MKKRKEFSYPMPIVEKFPDDGNIMEKIGIARHIYTAHADFILSDRKISSMFREYNREIANTQNLMRESGLISICARCAAHNPGGSCCGRGIEEWYEVTTLLFNLILGREIITDPPGPEDCLFLGPRGCRLWARHHFCVNYLCHRVPENLPEKDVQHLQAQAGRELFLCWQLEREVLRKLRNAGALTAIRERTQETAT